MDEGGFDFGCIIHGISELAKPTEDGPGRNSLAAG